MTRYDIRLAGMGGQGLILAGTILGEAGAVYEKKHTIQTISYAPLVRGAPSRSEVVISDDPIHYPEVEDADVLLALSQESFDVFKDRIKPGGFIIADIDNIETVDRSYVEKFEISKMAKMSTGRTITSSIVGLGLISALTGTVSRESLENAIRGRAPKGTIEINLRALEEGLSVSSNRNKSK